MSLPSLSPSQAFEKLQKGAVIIDIRSPFEFAGKHIPEARSLPLDQLRAEQLPENQVVIFNCFRGTRTRKNAHLLRQYASRCAEAYQLDGGLQAWEKAGLQVQTVPGQGLDIMRQVQIAAGSLVVLGVLGGFLLSPVLYLLSGFVGAGLVFAGITGSCGMAKILTAMPWNRM